MFNAGDKVEVIATGRPGEINKIDFEGEIGKTVPRKWHGRYTDGKEPATFCCHDEKELKSMEEEPDLGMSPDEPIQGSL